MGTWWLTALVITGAYLWGAFPTSYVLLKLARGMDIRKTGSGNVGSTNLMVNMGFKVGLAVGMFDCLVKGTLPVALVRAFDLAVPVQASVGLAVVAGHSWSPYIRFTGGRGMATAIGAIMGFLGWREAIILIVLAGVVGRRITKQFALWMGIGIAVLPVVAYLTGAPTELVWFDLGLLGIAALKRLTANWERPWPGERLHRVLWHRLIFDRDIADHKAWITRGVARPWVPRTH